MALLEKRYVPLYTLDAEAIGLFIGEMVFEEMNGLSRGSVTGSKRVQEGLRGVIG
jgi:hypothetical protein